MRAKRELEIEEDEEEGVDDEEDGSE